jgi:hypothetical protein
VTTLDLPSTLTPRQARAALRILDSLDRCEDRLNEHYGRQRKQKRTGFRGVVTLLIPSESEGVEPNRILAYARNVSTGGMSFIHPGPLAMTKIIVGLTFDPINAAWFDSEIVRGRPVEDGFWEFGVAFRERLPM